MVEVIKVSKPNSLPARYVVKVDGKEVGVLEKYPDSRTEKHPWKAFKGIGNECTFLQAYYPNEGGKEAAIKQIVQWSAYMAR